MQSFDLMCANAKGTYRTYFSNTFLCKFVLSFFFARLIKCKLFELNSIICFHHLTYLINSLENIKTIDQKFYRRQSSLEQWCMYRDYSAYSNHKNNRGIHDWYKIRTYPKANNGKKWLKIAIIAVSGSDVFLS